MVFNSLQFAAFLPVVWLAYRSLSGVRGQNAWLALASYVFYGWWDWRFLGLIILSTVVDFVLARGMEGRPSDERMRLLYISVAVNLGALAIFKYLGFFVDSAVDVLASLGLDPNRPLLEIVLPVGISFYTFQTLSYTFDVARGEVEAERDLVTFAAYVAYFPQLVAGPIERASHLLPQLQRAREPVSRALLGSGCRLILLGLFKKVALADAVAPVVNETFGGPTGTIATVAGVLGFSLQIYGDFSGYTDIARGTSRLFGIELVRNFREPYLSRNITEFWRTWHISLSDWLHSYLYIPLGGNRNGRRATYRNLMITMLLGGLWHGASWNFVVWGALHGLYLAIDRSRGRAEPRGARRALRFAELPSVLCTFLVVTLTWVFFRAESFGDAAAVFAGLVAGDGAWAPEDVLLVALVATQLLVIDLIRRGQVRVAALLDVPVLRGAAYGFAALSVILWSGGGGAEFIYFQF